ncbi:MAG: Fis family transcriptional regulator [Thermoprotei archaeon]|nr:MAG: Fis family transcriptional regulator [Thermoprotei archaeon]
MTILHEVAAKKIVPLLRGVLVHELYSRGFSQRKIAYLLGVTQPQVYKYLSKPIDEYYHKALELRLDTDRLKYYVKLLADTLAQDSSEKYVLLVNSIVQELTLAYLCREHKEMRELCRTGRISDPYLEYYRERVERIVSRYRIESLVPEVGINIVYTPVKPRSPVDVIGLTGRIIKAGNRALIVGEPMYGGSRHLSRVLIMAAKYNNRRRVAMNTAYVRRVESLKRIYRVEYCGPHSSINEFWESLEKVLTRSPDIVADLGGYGLEPVVYILANSFEDLENALKHIASDRD